MRQLGVGFCLFIFCAAVLVANTALGLKTGKYEETVTIEMNGKAMSEPNVHSKCISAEDLQEPEAVFNERVFKRYKPDPTCATHNLTNSGGKISYDEDCTNRKVHVDATVSGTEYSAVRSVTAKSGSSAFTYKMKGKRTGDCAK